MPSEKDIMWKCRYSKKIIVPPILKPAVDRIKNQLFSFISILVHLM